MGYRQSSQVSGRATRLRDQSPRNGRLVENRPESDRRQALHGNRGDAVEICGSCEETPEVWTSKRAGVVLFTDTLYSPRLINHLLIPFRVDVRLLMRPFRQPAA